MNIGSIHPTWSLPVGKMGVSTPKCIQNQLLPAHCKICGASFADQKLLNQHSMTHLKEILQRRQAMLNTSAKTPLNGVPCKLVKSYQDSLDEPNMTLEDENPLRMLSEVSSALKERLHGNEASRKEFKHHQKKAEGVDINGCEKEKGKVDEGSDDQLQLTRLENKSQTPSISSTASNELSDEAANIDVHEFACDLCDKRFIDEGHYKRHVMLTHTLKEHIKMNLLPKNTCALTIPTPSVLEGKGTTTLVKANAHTRSHSKHGMVKKDGIIRPEVDSRRKLGSKTKPAEVVVLKATKKPKQVHLFGKVEKKESVSNDDTCLTVENSAPITESKNYQITNFKCHMCNKSLQDFSEMRAHVQQHYNTVQISERPHVCKKCGRSFAKEKTLLRHQVKQHQGCSVCHRTFKDLSHLREHMSTHTGAKEVVCKFCNKCFTRRRYLKKHYMYLHAKEAGLEELKLKEFTFECPDCPKIFPCQSQLTVHMRMHNDQRPFQCEYCDKSFKKNYDLKIHRVTHNKDMYNKDMHDKDTKPTSDNVDDTKHVTDVRLAIERGHTSASDSNVDSEDKNFQCDDCFKLFTSLRSLKQHVRLHKRGR